ncbi:MAG TPA: DUF6541 family protein [Gaiellaceae bacterium]|nr:DUF6541 family protein [Gaiellaceae bacterium]
MTGIVTYLRLAFGTAVALAPGFLLARALGLRGVAATLAWSLAALFGCLAVTFAVSGSLTTTLVLLGAVAGGAAIALARRRGRLEPAVPGRSSVFALGVLLGLGLWSVAGSVQGDGLFHLARVRKLVSFDDLSLHSVVEFADGGLHPGYAFPLWHGFDAVVARVSGADPGLVVLHLPSILVPLAVVVAYEAGWALFRRMWAAAVAAAAQVVLVCFAPGHGGSYRFLALPATAADQLLVPAALALAFETIRRPSPTRIVSVAAAGLALAVVHPTYAIFLWLPFAGFLVVRVLWTREDLRSGLVALAALVVPAALFMLWLVPVVRKTASVSPSSAEVRRALAQYAGQLNVRSDTSYSLAAEVFTRRGAVAIAALLLLPLSALAARRRWAAYVAGGSLAVFVVMLVPFFFTTLSDVVSISQSRRAAGFLPFAFGFAGGIGVLAALAGPFLPPLALVAGVVFQLAYPGDFNYVLDQAGPSWVVWLGVAGTIAAVAVGLVRRQPSLEAPAGLAAAFFLAPVVVVGAAHWSPAHTPLGSSLSSGLVDALRHDVPKRSVVYSDPETSYRIAASAPVYIAVAPPGHVADTTANVPYVRARDARRFLKTGDLAIPRRYGARYLVVDRLRLRRSFDLPVLYRDPRFVLYRLGHGP